MSAVPALLLSTSAAPSFSPGAFATRRYLITAGALQANHRYAYVVVQNPIGRSVLEKRSTARSSACIAAMPEPGAFAMLAMGVLAVAGMARRRVRPAIRYETIGATVRPSLLLISTRTDHA